MGVRVCILALPACMFVVWIVTMLMGNGLVDALGNPVGADFAMFYLAGQAAANGQWSELYNEPLQHAKLLEQFPGLAANSYLPFRYPPLVAIIALPLGSLPYSTALVVFFVASVTAWLVSLRLLVSQLLPDRTQLTESALLAIACSPVVLQTLIDGQASTLWFAIAALCWISLLGNHSVPAGCILALAACKPNVMLLLGIVLIIRYPRMLLGLIPTALVMLAVTLAIAGVGCLQTYLELARQLALSPWSVETPFWKVQSLLSWTELVSGPAARRVNLAIGLCLASALGLWWRQHSKNGQTDFWPLSGALIINALFNPYTPIYDLTLLNLGLVVGLAHAARTGALESILQRRDVQLSLVVLLAGPILSQFAAKTMLMHLQFFPLALIAMSIYWLGRKRAKPESVSSPTKRERSQLPKTQNR